MTESSSDKKGRPTPKRNEAIAARKVSSLAPASTKAEKKRAKDASRAARIANRAAYMRGDENALPARDKGPVKRFVRNYVDSRKSIGEYFLPIIFVVLFLTLIPYPIFQIGSIIIMYGARLADGCTSGHGISGCLQLAVSGWLFFIVMFASGILTAKLLYGRSRQA